MANTTVNTKECPLLPENVESRVRQAFSIDYSSEFVATDFVGKIQFKIKNNMWKIWN